MMKFATLALVSASLIATPIAASAATSGEQRTTGVTYSDLDLSTEQGRAELDRRIDNAARQVCGMDDAVLGTRLPGRQERQCYREAREQLDRHFARVIEQNRGQG